MKKAYIVIMTVAFLALSAFAYAGSDVFGRGLLGAGSGAVGGLASGAKGKNVWKGALAGAGVNVIGGALLDNHSGEEVTKVDNVKNLDSTSAYKQGYQDGFENGYKQGYTVGYKEGLRDGTKGKVNKN